MPHDETQERLTDRLIEALAAQVQFTADRTLAPEAVAALAELDRAEARLFFGAAGHLVHYGGFASIAKLIELVADTQRAEADPDAALRPGDQVYVVQALLPAHERHTVPWWGEVPHVVRYVEDVLTVDVQPELTEEYVIDTVSAAALRPAPE